MSLDSFQYLILMGACVAITLPLEVLLRARVYRRWRLLLPTLAVVILVFGIWDLIGIVRDHWTYSDRYLTGVAIGPLPLEELVFFVVIPLCGLLSYEGVATVLRGLASLRARRRASAPARTEEER